MIYTQLRKAKCTIKWPYTISVFVYRKLKTGVDQIRLLCVCVCVCLFISIFLSVSLLLFLLSCAFTFQLLDLNDFCLHQFCITVVLYLIFKLQHPNCNGNWMKSWPVYGVFFSRLFFLFFQSFSLFLNIFAHLWMIIAYSSPICTDKSFFFCFCFPNDNFFFVPLVLCLAPSFD